jgi:predicted metallopeptidase
MRYRQFCNEKLPVITHIVHLKFHFISRQLNKHGKKYNQSRRRRKRCRTLFAVKEEGRVKIFNKKAAQKGRL